MFLYYENNEVVCELGEDDMQRLILNNPLSKKSARLFPETSEILNPYGGCVDKNFQPVFRRFQTHFYASGIQLEISFQHIVYVAFQKVVEPVGMGNFIA